MLIKRVIVCEDLIFQKTILPQSEFSAIYPCFVGKCKRCGIDRSSILSCGSMIGSICTVINKKMIYTNYRYCDPQKKIICRI